MTQLDDIRDAAQRALERAQTRIGDAIEAKLEWSFRTTLTNALRRDAAQTRAEGWDDVEVIAKYVLDRTSPAEQAAAAQAEREEKPRMSGIIIGDATVWTYAGQVEDPEREALHDQIGRYTAALDAEREESGRLRNLLEHRDRIIASVRRTKDAEIRALADSVQTLAESYEQAKLELESCRRYANYRDRTVGIMQTRLTAKQARLDQLRAALADTEQSATAWHRIAEEYRAEAVMAESLLQTIAEEAESLNLALSSDPLISHRTARARVQNIHGLAVSIEVNRGA